MISFYRAWHRNGCLRLRIPKEDLPLFQSAARHLSLFKVSDLLYISDCCIAVFNGFCVRSFRIRRNTTFAPIYSPVTWWLYPLRGKAAYTMGSNFLFPIPHLLAVRKTCACADLGHGKIQKRKSVSSTSRRGAGAAYHVRYPRDFGPRIAYTVISFRYLSAPDQAGRERNVGP